jgi:DNA-binding transcriptional LysR family regulator
MEIQQLTYFLTVAQLEHMTKAANILHIAQPALSQCIKRLEKELNVSLFTRTGRNIQLNDNGRHLQTLLKPIMAALKNIPQEFSKRALSEIPIKLNISAATALMTEILIQYKIEHPETSFALMQDATDKECDISISTVISLEGQQESDVVLDEEIFIAVPINSVFAKRTSLRLDELSKLPFISFSGSKPLRQVCDQLCNSVGIIPNIVFESDSPQVVRSLIEAGMGVGFWPAFSWGKFSSNKAILIPIGSPICRRQLILSINKDARSSTTCCDFYTYVIDHIKLFKQI